MSGDHSVRVELWRTEGTDETALEVAVDALEADLAPQIGPGIAVATQGTIAVPEDTAESYRGYLDLFEETADLGAEAVNVCLYTESLLGEVAEEAVDRLLEGLDGDGVVCCGSGGGAGKLDRFPWAGYMRGHYRPGERPHGVVNADWLALETMDLLDLRDFETVFRNFVVHETLHALLDARADAADPPVDGDDHSFGTVRDGAASPLLTGYVEEYSLNDPPDRACDLASPDPVAEHTTTLSECTRAEIERFLAARSGDTGDR